VRLEFLYKFVWNISYSKENSAKYYHTQILKTVQFYGHISKNPQTSNFINIRLQATELFRAHRHINAQTQYGQTQRSLKSIFVILRTSLKTGSQTKKPKKQIAFYPRVVNSIDITCSEQGLTPPSKGLK